MAYFCFAEFFFSKDATQCKNQLITMKFQEFDGSKERHFEVGITKCSTKTKVISTLGINLILRIEK